MKTRTRNPKAGKGQRLGAGLIILAATSVLSASCGIESVQYYNTPGFATSGSNSFTITHDTGNTQNFLGYNIYYHAYQTSTQATTAKASIDSILTSSTPSSAISQMTSAGFLPMYLASAPTTTPTPLCKVPSAYVTNTAVQFNFIMDYTNSSTNWYYTISTDSSNTQYGVVRDLNKTSNNSYEYQYDVGDADYYASATNAVGQGGTVYLVMYAVAYGYDLSSLTTIYSFPATLSTVVSYTLPSS